MPQEPKLADEIKRMEYEPLLPIEKRLIIWSLLLGVGLLALLVWVSGKLFPG
ncbi:MAG TPA: hypothetical protein VN829_13710 [Dongiaceae bacterium]|nr:hypothetical protein [Dongiaceae bacterium]